MGYVNGTYVPTHAETGYDVSKLNDTLTRLGEREHNVKAEPYGAVGNGIVDDYAAITAAITAANTVGGTVYFPPGTYKVSQTLDLTNLNFQHWHGGHKGHSGLIQFAMPPSVVIDGTAMADGAGPAVKVRDSVSATGGNHTFENIIFWGNDQGFYGIDSARVKFNNCGFRNDSTTATDRSGLKLERSFWYRFVGCTFHAPSSSDPAIVMKATNGINTDNCGLMSFDWCVFATGCIDFQIDTVPAEDVGNIQFRECFTEGAPQPFITFRETSALSSNYSIIGMSFTDCGIADSGSGDVPFIYLNASTHASLRAPRFSWCDNPGRKAIKVAASGGAVVNALIIGSGARTGLVADASGVASGSFIHQKNSAGLNLAGTSALLTETDITANAGPLLRLAKTADKWASVGIEPGTGTSSGLLFGAGGTGADPGWDTNLYRNAANELKTDDAFTSSLALTASKALVQKETELADTATVAVDASLGTHFYLQTSSSRTIGPPTNPTQGQVITFYIAANAGGIATTWDAAYHLAGAWTDPANNKTRVITFAYVSRSGSGLRWLEVSRSAADQSS